MNEKIYEMLNPQSFPTPFCPGCGHGILMGAVLRAIAELEYDMKQILFASGIGCAAWIPSPHFKADTPLTKTEFREAIRLLRAGEGARFAPSEGLPMTERR